LAVARSCERAAAGPAVKSAERNNLSETREACPRYQLNQRLSGYCQRLRWTFGTPCKRCVTNSFHLRRLESSRFPLYGAHYRVRRG
jgi:hypothetical protein